VVDLYAPSAEVASAAKAGKHKKPKTVLLGTETRTGVASGALTLSVSLNSKGKHALHRHGHLSVTVVTTVTPPTGSAQTQRSSVILHAH
jgi:hypothetical protein